MAGMLRQVRGPTRDETLAKFESEIRSFKDFIVTPDPANRSDCEQALEQENAKTLELEGKTRAIAGDAVEALREIALHGESESARVAAAVAILDRAYGRPRQALEHTGEGRGPVEHRVRVVWEGRAAGAGPRNQPTERENTGESANRGVMQRRPVVRLGQ